jgi:hypothetical protein
MAKRKSVVFEHYFFHFLLDEEFYSPVDSVIGNAPAYWTTIAEAFRANLHAIIDTLTMPAVMALTAIQSARYERLVLANTFRIMAEAQPMSKDELDAEARRRARVQLDKESKVKKHIKAGTQSVIHSLEGSLNNRQMRVAAAELLRQGVTLTWTALEVLMTDVFVATLNNFPALSVKLLEDVRTRKWFQFKDPFPSLQAHSYDLSRHMGDVLGETHRIDDVDTFRAMADVIFSSNQELRTLVADSRLWLLHQRRNLLLHRRGIVDDLYLKNTGESTASKGSPLAISTDYVRDSLAYTRDLGKALLQSDTSAFC